MPHIATAMRQSVRKSVADIVFDSLLGRRGIEEQVTSVKDTFSSWDNCMSQTYCKWPIIAAIIICGLIVFSILACIIRCACCGLSCCCSCFSFLKCCDCCGGACDGKKNKAHRHMDEYPDTPLNHGYQPPNQGYQAPVPMMGGALASSGTPQFAQFEVGKNGFAVEKTVAMNEDALPPMPSWDAAANKHILTEEEKNAVELGELDPTTGQKLPLMAGGVGINAPPSPMNDMGSSPYGIRPGQGNNGYMGVASEQSSQNLAKGGRGYRDPRGGPAIEGRGYESQGGRGYGQQSPQNPYGNNQDQYADDGYDAGYSQNQRGQPERQYSSNDQGRNYPPQPTRQYSNQTYQSSGYQNDNYQSNGPPQSRVQGRVASPPLNNNSGFDFGTGAQDQYSRPQIQQQQSYSSSQQGSTPAPSYVTHTSRSPAPQEVNGGYNSRPYQTASRSTPQALMPGGAYGGREPDRWDPVQQQ